MSCGGDGVLALENLMCRYFYAFFLPPTSWQEPKLLGGHLNKKTLNLEKSLPALELVSKCQDTTDWIEAEDFPFLWFFCLFWVYTIIKKSLVLAGNGKTKQNKETTLPWLIAAVLWPDLVKLFIFAPNFGVWGLQVENYIQRKHWKGQGCSFQKAHWI